jgi:hypothetical protein
MQALTVTDSLAPIRRQFQQSLQTLAQRDRLYVVLTGFGVTVLSAMVAPGSGASLWDWTRLLLIVAAGTVAAATLVAARDAVDDGAHLAIALAATSLALASAATFGLATAALCSLALSSIDATVMSERLGQTPEVAAAALAVLTPWWVWTALDAWDHRLLLLVPLAALGLNALAHARLAEGRLGVAANVPLSTRGHHLGAWLSLAAGATVLLLVGVGTGAAGGWLAFGGLACGVAIAVASGAERLRESAARRLYPGLPLLAFAVLGVTWLAAL